MKNNNSVSKALIKYIKKKKYLYHRFLRIPNLGEKVN